MVPGRLLQSFQMNAWGCRLVGTPPLLGSSASLPLAPLSTTQVFDKGLTEVLTSPNARIVPNAHIIAHQHRPRPMPNFPMNRLEVLVMSFCSQRTMSSYHHTVFFNLFSWLSMLEEAGSRFFFRLFLLAEWVRHDVVVPLNHR